MIAKAGAGDFAQLLQLTIGGWYPDAGRSRMRGVVPHEGGGSIIEVWDFDAPLERVPSVNCWADWVRKDPEWHYETQRGRFCWVLEEEWIAFFGDAGKRSVPQWMMSADAAMWLAGAMRLMLGRHWTGDHYGMKDWPMVWEDYSHGSDGVHEYQKGTYRKS